MYTVLALVDLLVLDIKEIYIITFGSTSGGDVGPEEDPQLPVSLVLIHLHSKDLGYSLMNSRSVFVGLSLQCIYLVKTPLLLILECGKCGGVLRTFPTLLLGAGPEILG